MPRLRSGALACWVTAWLRGDASADDVLDAVTGGDAPHLVVGLDDGGGSRAEPLSAALIRLRARAEALTLVLPVPGDVRALPGPAPFRAAALEVGEAVHGGGLGLVPSIRRQELSSAPTAVTWRAYPVGPAPVEHLSLSEASQELGRAIRETADELREASLDAPRADPGDALSDARRAGERLDLPPGFPAPATALLAQAERLTAVLELAGRDVLGGAVDRAGIDARAAALAPLAHAVRRARLAAFNAGAERLAR